MKAYVIGPVTGYENDNLPAFEYARSRLTDLGISAEIPHDFIPSGTSWSDAMKISIKHLLEADYVCALPGWAESRGACLEWQIACAVGIPAIFLCGDAIIREREEVRFGD